MTTFRNRYACHRNENSDLEAEVVADRFVLPIHVQEAIGRQNRVEAVEEVKVRIAAEVKVAWLKEEVQMTTMLEVIMNGII